MKKNITDTQEFKYWDQVKEYLESDTVDSEYVNSVKYYVWTFTKYGMDCNDPFCKCCSIKFTSTEEAIKNIKKRCGNVSLVSKWCKLDSNKNY